LSVTSPNPNLPAPLVIGVRLESERSPIAGVPRALKRLVDIGISAALLIVMFPVMVVLALLIKCQDRGPIFHRRRVLGPAGEFDAEGSNFGPADIAKSSSTAGRAVLG